MRAGRELGLVPYAHKVFVQMVAWVAVARQGGLLCFDRRIKAARRGGLQPTSGSRRCLRLGAGRTASRRTRYIQDSGSWCISLCLGKERACKEC